MYNLMDITFTLMARAISMNNYVHENNYVIVDIMVRE